MAKYDELGNFLRKQSLTPLRLSFDQVQAVVPGGLPPSAYKYSAWWANEEHGNHVHARAWMDTGWRVTRVDLRGHTVTFARASTAQG